MTKLKSNRAAFLHAFADRVDAKVKDAALQCEAEAKKAIQTGAKTGRTYRRGVMTVAGGPRNTTLFAGMLMGRTAQGRLTAGLARTASNRIIVGSKIHRASAPGQAPATDTGNLANSIRSRRIAPGRWRVSVYAKYGRALEIGNSKIRARPYLRPAYRAQKLKLIGALRNMGSR